ncbi:MAG: ATP-binding protein [Acidobacteriota bacterium]|nr:ATP-binding protein [Acidobacteriota bacterium]
MVQSEKPEELRQRIAVLEERLSALPAAVMRVSGSLDLKTVLQEVLDSARALTGASRGVIATEDEGQAEHLITSGFEPEEHDGIVAWPHGAQLFAHFRDLQKPLRLANLQDYVGQHGFPSTPMRSQTLQCTPLHHRDVYVGSFFLADKDGGQEFTESDEEVLVLFASQAATAIANARAHRDEQRARADLEALVEMSPVGVVVFDGQSGKPVSFNREARRIVSALRTPGDSPEELLDDVICRRDDGREVTLAEFPLAQQWTDPETVRAEEMTLSVPDGRSVTTLVNATPTRSKEGAIESMVVTLQDLTPLEELDRLRAEFLSMVSHELRAPLISIKGSTATVLGAAPAPDPAEMLQFFRVIDDQANQMRNLIADLLDQGRIAAGTLSVSAERAEVAGLIDQARSSFTGAGSRRNLTIDLPEDLPFVLADSGRIVQVLNNLLSNAALHSPDSSPITVGASLDDDHVAISVTDRGSGVPPEKLPHLFRKQTDASGEKGVGLGLAICKGLVEAHGGRIWAESGEGDRGTRFTFTLPVAVEAGDVAPSALSRRPRSSKRNGATPILVLDDDPQTLRRVRDALSEAGYAAILTGDPNELPKLIRTHRPRLVLLDLVLPDTDGLELMETVPELEDVPVIFISVYDRDETIVRALDARAADYIVKPFSPSELTARVRAALRRQAEPKPFRLGDLSINYEEREVTMDGRSVALTVTEFEVLRVLSSHAGRVVTYESLLRQAWSKRARSTEDPKLVRAMVKSLRRKLGDDAAQPAYVLNERGVGYRMPRPGSE